MPWKFSLLRLADRARQLVASPGSSYPRTWTWVILPLGLGLSWLAFHAAAGISEREAQYRFEVAAADARHRVVAELRAYEQVVYGLQALFSANAEVSSVEFDRYVATLDLASRYPAYAALTFARYVPAPQREAHERRVRQSGRLGPQLSRSFRIRAPEGLPYHFAIDYVYPPEAEHVSTVGIDITAEPVRRPAIEGQVETGRLTSSGIPITQVSRQLDSNVLPMRVAVYRHGMPLATVQDRWRALMGSVGAAFHVRALFDQALRDVPRGLSLRVYDVGSADEPNHRHAPDGMLIYDNSQPDRHMASREPITRKGGFEQLLAVDWATRRWLLQFTRRADALAGSDLGWPMVVLAGGVTTTLLLFAWLQALAHARAQAESARRAQSTFLANMSHELRTPLNAILGYAQILGMAHNLDERQLAGVLTIRRSGDHLLALIDDILDLARVEAGRLELVSGEFDLGQFLQGVAEIVRVRAAEKGVAFRFAPPTALAGAVHGDEKRLRQVLLNLLGNAVKFTDHGWVELRVQCQEAPAHAPGVVTLRFEVEDSGVGISARELTALFEPFEQAGEMERRRGGTGLGLAISRQLVRLMGSDIQVRSVPGKGSVFTFTLSLPLVPASQPRPSVDRLPTGYAGPRRKVLVVDDSADNRAVLADVLQPLGFEVFHAADGAQGLQRAAELLPDVILMDNVMPVMDGLEATRRLRSQHTLDQVPVIAISASAAKDDMQRAMEAGATAFMSKPFRAAALLALMEQHLGLRFTYD